MVSYATNDLDAYLKDVQDKIDRLQAGDANVINEVAVECHTMLEEKESTQRGLDMCAKLSTEIAQFESASKEPFQFQDRPSAQKNVQAGLGEVKGSIESLVDRLQAHEAVVNSHLEAISLNEEFAEPVAKQLQQLQKTKESINKCIQIVSQASELADERSNVFEDITMADNSNAFSVSLNDLFIAGPPIFKNPSRLLDGKISDESIRRLLRRRADLPVMDGKTKLGAAHPDTNVDNSASTLYESEELDSTPTLVSIRQTIRNAQGENVPRYKVHCTISWSVRQFCDRELSETGDLFRVITLSGSPTNAQADSSADFVQTIWETKQLLYWLVKVAVGHDEGEKDCNDVSRISLNHL